MINKMVSAFVALGVNPQAKSSSWLARRLNHLQAFGLIGASASAIVQVTASEQPPADRPAANQQEPELIETAKAKGKKTAKKE